MDNSSLGTENVQDGSGILCHARKQEGYERLGLGNHLKWLPFDQWWDSLIISKNNTTVD